MHVFSTETRWGSPRRETHLKHSFWGQIFQENTLHTFVRSSKSCQPFLIILSATWSCDAPLENWHNQVENLKLRFLIAPTRHHYHNPATDQFFQKNWSVPPARKWAEILRIRARYMWRMFPNQYYTHKVAPHQFIWRMAGSCPWCDPVPPKTCCGTSYQTNPAYNCVRPRDFVRKSEQVTTPLNSGRKPLKNAFYRRDI